MSEGSRLSFPARAVLLAAATLAIPLALLRWSGATSAARPMSAQQPAAPNAPAQATPGAGQIIVRGRIQYVDRSADKKHPAAGIRVEIWDLDSGFPTTGEKLGETMTDANGRFESPPMANVDRDGPTGRIAGTQDVFLKLFTNNGSVKLLKSGTDQDFGWVSYEVNLRDGKLDDVKDGFVGFPEQLYMADTRDVRALWTYVNIAEAWLYVKDFSGRDPGKVTAYWSPESLDGPRYDQAARSLHFRGEDADYGTQIGQYTAYALLHNVYEPLPALWAECIAAPPKDPRLATSAACALVHGFAMFLPLGVARDAHFETPEVAEIDMDAAKAGSVGWSDGDTVPGRVTGALWDLHENDLTTETFDTFNTRFGDIWQVFADRHPATMKEWWDGWRALKKNGCAAVGSLFQNTINYNTPPTIQPIPDVVLDEDETAILDLTNYVDDADCGDDDILIRMVDAGKPEAGVKLMPSKVISITPQADWSGDTRVTIAVSDGLVESQQSFRVIVNAINDCVTLLKRIPDPRPAGNGAPITVDLSGYAEDKEDNGAQLQWDAEIDAPHDKQITVAGRRTQVLTFVLNPSVTTAYSARVKLVVYDRDGCSRAQYIALYWSDEKNTPPVIDFDKLKREYQAPVNQTIYVDLTGVARDKEDPPQRLEWFVTNHELVSAQEKKLTAQSFDFVPYDGFVGSSSVNLEVQDSGGARASAQITLTWKSALEGNLPPEIIRTQLKGLSGAMNGEVCYDLTDMARDPDDSKYALRWFITEFDDTSMFVGPQGRRELCMRARADFEGCVTGRFVVKDPKDASDDMLVSTCWKKVEIFLPVTVQTGR